MCKSICDESFLNPNTYPLQNCRPNITMVMSDPYAFDDAEETSAEKGRRSTSKAQRTSGRQQMLTSRLKFNQRITPTSATKPIPTNELVKRLKDLHGQLSKLDQEDIDKSSLHGVRKDLISRSLFMHKDKAVRVLTACCLADILRLFAPDAPYNQSELRDIFEFFLKQINNISDTQGPYFENYFYLLESLSTVKSIVLVSDINAEELVTQIFHDFFVLVWPDMQKNLYGFMLDILQQLIEECPILHPEVVDIIMNAFSDKKTPENLPAYQLAVDLCKNAGDRLQRYVCHYFGDLFVSAAKEPVDKKELDATHQLIFEINAQAKDVLLNVIPLLEEELKFENYDVRLVATELLGKMIAEPGSTLAKTYPSTFRTWLERYSKNQPTLIAELSVCLEEKMREPDDKIRVIAVKMFSHFDANVVAYLPHHLLLQLGDRCKDKKASIRFEALGALSGIYKMMYDKMLDNLQVEEKVSWIPGWIVETLFLDDPETKVGVEKALFENIFPVNMDDAVRTERLLQVLSGLNEKQYRGFLSVLDRQANTINAMKAFVGYCEKWNSGIMDTPDPSIEKGMNGIMHFLVDRFPDPKKAQAHFLKFAKANENITYKLFYNIMDEKADYKSILKNNKELLKRLDEQGVKETFSIVLRRISLTLLGKSSIPEKKRHRSEENGKEERRGIADTVLQDMASRLPRVFLSHVSELLRVLETNDLTLISESLETLARFVKISPSDIHLTSEALDTLKVYALEGRQRQARNAAKLIALLGFSSAKDEVLKAIVSSLTAKNLQDALDHDANPQTIDSEMDALKKGLAAKLITLGQFALHCSSDFEKFHIPIINFIVKEILLKSRSRTDIHGDEDWVSWDDLGVEGVYKTLGLRLISKRVQGLAHRQSNNFKEVARPFLKLLNVILENDGEVSPNPPKPTSPAFRSHLRLTASLILLKLSKIPEFDALTGLDEFCRLSLSMQDQAWQVRDVFIDKLRKYFNSKDVPFRYLVFLMMAAHEPDADMKKKVITDSLILLTYCRPKRSYDAL
ncbi:armadillo-type protein [Chytridium lagenaria]|nr:armadillo-type protein [Chytridium lagenaria]